MWREQRAPIGSKQKTENAWKRLEEAYIQKLAEEEEQEMKNIKWDLRLTIIAKLLF